MVTAARGAEEFYTIEHHASRSENIEQARDRDTLAASVDLLFTLFVTYANIIPRPGLDIPTWISWTTPRISSPKSAL